MRTTREAQKVCARLNDAVAIVTHQLSESRAKSALISITSFSGRYPKIFSVNLNSTAFQAGSPVFAVALTRPLSLFPLTLLVQSEPLLFTSSTLLCSLVVRPPLEQAFGSEGISCWFSHFSCHVLPMTNMKGGCKCCFTKC